MFIDPNQERGSGFRNFFLVTIAVLLFGGGYVGWVFYSRWEANQELERKAAEQERSQDKQTFDAMGGNRFDILSFGANPTVVDAGERSSLCYSVSNAKSVTIEPKPDEETWPAFSRCVNVSPRKTTTYTITIDDGAGHTKSAAVEVRVR